MTFCPVNGLPDLLYVEITYKNQFVELYSVRKQLRQFMWRKMYMEEVAQVLSDMHPEAERVVVRLAFNRHRVDIQHF